MVQIIGAVATMEVGAGELIPEVEAVGSVGVVGEGRDNRDITE